MKNNYGIRYKITALTFCIFFLFGLLKNSAFSQNTEKKNILILNSYHDGFKWTDGIMEGIKDILVDEGEKTVLRVEYMDTKRMSDETYLQKLYELYQYKFKDFQFDMIISSDNHAFEFLKKYHQVLFSDTPVAFCGVNNFADSMLKGEDLFTGVTEEINLKGTIDIALQLHSNTKHIFAVVDETTTGMALKRMTQKIIPFYSDTVQFEFLENMSIDELERVIGQLPVDSIVFFLSTYKDELGQYVSLTEGTKLLSNKTYVPIYAPWDFLLGQGVVGGIMKSGYEQGKVAGQLALRILNGEFPADIPVIKENQNKYMFDYNQLQRFNIQLTDLPEDSIVINKPSPFYLISKYLIWSGVFIVMGILIVIVFILLRNISKRKEIENELRKSEELFHTFMDTSPDIIAIMDGQGRFLEVNPACIKLLDIEGVDYKGKTYWNLPQFKKNNKDNIEIYLETDKSTWEKGVNCHFEQAITHPDGTIKVHDTTKVPTFYPDGRRKTMFILGRDITERKQAEEGLRENHERYQLFFKLLPDAIYVYNDNEMIFTNKAGAKLVGVDCPEKIIGEDIFDFSNFHSDFQEHVRKRRKQLFSGEKDILPLMEEKYIRHDGTVIDIEVAGVSFEYKGKRMVMLVVHDIAERKKTEALRRKAIEQKRLLAEAREYDKLRTEFFANLSHEFRTPLNIIFSSMQLLDQYTENHLTMDIEKINKYKNVTKQNCLRLLRLVNNLIDITRIDADFFELHLKNCNIVSIVENITLSVSEYIESKQLKLLFDTDVEEKIMACDGNKIERVILNLLSNAVKFSKPGSIINVNMYDKGDMIRICVKDNGIGIPKEKQKVIFDRFQQVDKSFTRSHEGSGIGLSLVQSLVEMHGGKIFVVSECGKGSEFVIELPVKMVSEEIGADINQHEEISRDNMERIHIEFSDIYMQ